MRGHYSVDVRGFWYALRLLTLVICFVIAAKYGIALAGERKSELTAAVAVPSMHTETASPTQSPPPLPHVGADAYIVAELGAGRILGSQNADTAFPIASITKLMTALIALETIPADSAITITADDRARSEGTPGRLPAQTTYRAGDLMYPLLMESNNAVGFALERANTGLIARMNERAAELGMLSTVFSEPTGLSAENRSSARDLLLLARHIDATHPEALEITRLEKHAIVSTRGKSIDVPNFNVFSKDPTFRGGKTGYTDDANQTMVALFEVSGKTFAIIVLGSKDRKADIEILRHWLSGALASGSL